MGLPFGTTKETLSGMLFKETGIQLEIEPRVIKSYGQKSQRAFILTSDETEHLKIKEFFRYF
jgi:hypothetical protein